MEFGLNCLVITQWTFKFSLHKSFFYELKTAMITQEKVAKKNIGPTFDKKSKKYDSPMAKFHR